MSIGGNIISIFKNNSLFQLFSSRLLIQVTTVLQSIIVSRLLGPEGKGIFTEITLWPTLIASFSMLGLYTGIVRISAKNNVSKRYNVSKGVLAITAITGLAGACAALLYSLITPYEPSYKIAACIFSSYVLIYNLNRGLSAINNGRQNISVFSISASILNPIFFLSIFSLFIMGNVSVTSLLYSLLFANLCPFIYLVIKNDEWHVKTKILPIRKTLAYSLRFSFADFAEPLYLYYDKALIALFLSPFDLGIYTIAYSASSLVNMLSQTFSIKLFSDVANGIEHSITRLVRVNTLLMISISLGLFLVFPFVIPFVFGHDFAPAIVPACILLVTCIIQGQATIVERCILAKGKPFVGVQAKAITMAAFGVILLVFHVFGLFNVTNAAIITIISHMLYYKYIAKRFRQIFKTNDSLFPNNKDIAFLTHSLHRLFS